MAGLLRIIGLALVLAAVVRGIAVNGDVFFLCEVHVGHALEGFRGPLEALVGSGTFGL